MPKLFGFQQRKVSHSGVSLLRFNSPQILQTLLYLSQIPSYIRLSLFFGLCCDDSLSPAFPRIDTVFITGNSLLQIILSDYTMTTWIFDISSHLSSFTFLFRLKCLTQTNDSEMATLTNTTFHFIRTLRKTFSWFFQLFIWTS